MSNQELSFETTDLVVLHSDERILNVNGVIHDSERLFVIGDAGQEWEVPFSDVLIQYTRKVID